MVHEKRPCCGKGKLKRDETPPPLVTGLDPSILVICIFRLLRENCKIFPQ